MSSNSPNRLIITNYKKELTMTNRDCTAKPADLKNTPYLYPVIASSEPLPKHLQINEDDEDYDTAPKTDKAMQLSCKKLKAYLEQRLKHQKTLPVRIHIVIDDLYPRLRQYKKIDVFDLLVELILRADQDPAQSLSALLSVLDDEALINLERNDVANAAAFIRDAMKHENVRWLLQDYHERQEEAKTEED